MIPMIIALFSAIAFFGEDFQNTIISLLESIVPPYVWPVVEGMITDVVMRQNGTLSSFMLVIGIYFTIVCINGILVAMTSSYYTEEKRNIFNQIILSAGLVFLIPALAFRTARLCIVLKNQVIRSQRAIFPQAYSILVVYLYWRTFGSLYGPQVFLLSIPLLR